MHRIFTAILFTFLLAFPAQAEQTVVGVNDPGQDVANVQAAVAAGGTVILRGEFNFGHDGRVKITNSVRIKGEVDSVGEPTTKISGGYWTFYAPLPVKGAPPKGRGPVIAVHSINFEGAKGTPLHFPHVSGLDIRGCTISDVAPQTIGTEWEEGDTLAFQAGVVVGNKLDSPKKRVKNAVIGAISIVDNRFYMETPKPTQTVGYGVMVDWTKGADITIKDNVIQRASRNGIEVLDNMLDSQGGGSITIANNRITIPDEGIAYPHKYGPNGIVAGWYFDTSGGANFGVNNRISLTRNRIEARGEASTGMLLYSNDIVATCNDIIMGGGTEARGIVQTGSRGFFANNRIRGESRYAIYCHRFEALKAETNTFAWTDLNDFTGIKGQAFVAGNVNVFIGSVPSLTDKGKGNRVVDGTPCALPEVDPEGESWEPVDEE